jgi:hypothetical protein
VRSGGGRDCGVGARLERRRVSKSTSVEKALCRSNSKSRLLSISPPSCGHDDVIEASSSMLSSAGKRSELPIRHRFCPWDGFEFKVRV